MQYSDNGKAASIHLLLYIYNGFVVLVAAVFMAITQTKMVETMSASSFLAKVPVLPMPAREMVLLTVVAFLLMSLISYLYSRAARQRSFWRYILFLAEIATCIVLMRTINLSYDGLVLLLVADIMLRYEGRNQLIILLGAMALVYFIISYNIFLSYLTVIPFSLYLDYYSASFQSVLQPIRNLITYGNITIFVVYMVVLLQTKHQENEQIAKLNEKLQSTNDRLNESNGNLYSANAKLNVLNKQLREYAMTIAGMTEIQERNRLAREIHDTLGHALTGISAGVDACLFTIDIDPAATKQQLMKIRMAAQRGLTDVRRSMKKLRPDDLEKLSLEGALKNLVREFSEAGMTKARLEIVDLPDNLRDDQAEVVYRVLQEGMTNASRHGHASKVDISVIGEDDKLTIIIADDGIGCANIKQGFGLHHMQERLNMVGGSLNYWSEKGFVLDVSIPINKKGGNNK